MYRYVFIIGGGYRIVDATNPDEAFLKMGYIGKSTKTISKERIFHLGDTHTSQLVRSGVFTYGTTPGFIVTYSFYELPITDAIEGYIDSLKKRARI